MGAVHDKFSFYFLVKGSSAQGGIAGPSNACNCPEIAFVGNEIIFSWFFIILRVNVDCGFSTMCFIGITLSCACCPTPTWGHHFKKQKRG